MLKIIRLLLVVFFSILLCVVGFIYSLIRFKNPNNVYVLSKWFGRMRYFLGIKVEYRYPKGVDNFGPSLYVGNHQNNYDMVTLAYMIMPRTVTIGKKSLFWIPFFGVLYWLTGNILIDRNNRTKAVESMHEVNRKINKDRISIWMFPEGTRSRGRGLLPFKPGAFHLAISAGIPVVPVVCSTTEGKFDLNRWDNGKVICEMLDPIDISNYGRHDVRKLAKDCHTIMANKIAELDAELANEKKQQVANK